MKIATFNCNSVRARLPIIEKWLRDESPDILALQEIKVQTEEFPREPFENLGYICTVSGQKAHGGVATISKIKPKEIWAGFRDGDKSEESRILACKFSRLFVVNTYCPQGQDPESEVFQYKLKWFARLRKMFDEYYKKSGQVLWLGDFNVAPEPIDVYDSKRIMGHVCHRPEVFKALSDVREWGFIDLFRKFHPNEPGQYTYWDYRFPSLVRANRGWRVDHIYVSPPLSKKATYCRIDTEPRHAEKPSDHTFMYADFDL